MRESGKQGGAELMVVVGVGQQKASEVVVGYVGSSLGTLNQARHTLTINNLGMAT